jgi:hypothetical protein
MLRSPLSLSFETAFGLLRMRLKGRLEAVAEMIARKAYEIGIAAGRTAVRADVTRSASITCARLS